MLPSQQSLPTETDPIAGPSTPNLALSDSAPWDIHQQHDMNHPKLTCIQLRTRRDLSGSYLVAIVFVSCRLSHVSCCLRPYLLLRRVSAVSHVIRFFLPSQVYIPTKVKSDNVRRVNREREQQGSFYITQRIPLSCAAIGWTSSIKERVRRGPFPR